MTQKEHQEEIFVAKKKNKSKVKLFSEFQHLLSDGKISLGICVLQYKVLMLRLWAIKTDNPSNKSASSAF